MPHNTEHRIALDINTQAKKGNRREKIFVNASTHRWTTEIITGC